MLKTTSRADYVFARLEVLHGGPDRRFRRPVHVVHAATGFQKLRGQMVGERLSPAQHPEPLLSLPARLKEHLPGGGSGLDDRDFVFVDEANEFSWIARLVLCDEHEAAPRREREVQFQD